MHFSIDNGGVGLLGGWIIFGVLMIAFTIVVTLIARARRRDDIPRELGEQAPEDDYVL